ncbi:hypothetical protein [Mucilaginibacter xinganensis]|uniref:Glycosyltransferase RgtA/B/C/D-like domain-containing protein n=1 Tax=Mucilaginibacter xinganensis TaxID=1234841 RepID=A0A223P4P6_9SPHI|nr:hypothetical protein [Mucilaginibacter xinganensis]ASU36771.1 hypothetical protein MuYL_4888 [Mucilaginibacter xinganensis]
MVPQKSSSYKIILLVVGIAVLAVGVVLFFIPPALFPDPANGFNILRSMRLGSGFNVLSAPDQSDISQNYDEFSVWWSPGQYLVPYFFNLAADINIGQAMAVTVALAQLCGLAGFYCFFKKIGFTPFISALSLVFIVCQLAFFVPYVFYNGGEVLLFAFQGWFLYGCFSFKKTGWKMVLFVLFSGWIGFFCKSSFIWMYVAGLFCLWVSTCSYRAGILEWVKKGLWTGVPAAVSLAAIYVFFLSKGQSPATISKGFKLSAEAFSFPLSTPVLSGFSLDDFFHGLMYNFGRPMFSHQWALVILIVLAILSLTLIYVLVRKVPNSNYRLIIMVFYFGAVLFFAIAYLRQLNISYEARHFRIIGLLMVPGMLYLVARLKRGYQVGFGVLCLGIAVYSVNYLVKGYDINQNRSAKGVSGISQINIDQSALNAVMKLDRENKNAIFVFISNEIGQEILHNRVINLSPIADDLKIDMDEYRYDGFSGPLYIVLPESYNGPKEKMIMKSFPGYTGFNLSMLSDNYVLYSTNRKR